MKGKIIPIWSIKKNYGTSTISILTSMLLAREFKDKRILWCTTNNFFSIVKRSLNFKKGVDENSIDSLIDHMKEDKKYNEKLIEQATIKIKDKKYNNLYFLFESKKKERNYIEENSEKIFKIIIPNLKEYFDYIIIDTSSFIRSSVTKELIKKSDLLVNIFHQNSVAIEEYIQLRNMRSIDLTNNRINIINYYNPEVKPTKETMEEDIQEDFIIFKEDINLCTSCNTGNIIQYFQESSEDIENYMEKLLDSLGFKNKIIEESNNNFVDKLKGVFKIAKL